MTPFSLSFQALTLMQLGPSKKAISYGQHPQAPCQKCLCMRMLFPLHPPGLQILQVFLSLLLRCHHCCKAVAMSGSLTRWLA